MSNWEQYRKTSGLGRAYECWEPWEDRLVKRFVHRRCTGSGASVSAIATRCGRSVSAIMCRIALLYGDSMRLALQEMHVVEQDPCTKEGVFWICWVPGGNTPQHRHPSYFVAATEAKRLQDLLKGATVYVMQCVGYAEPVPPKLVESVTRWVDLR